MMVPRATSPYGMELLHSRFPPGATAFRKPGAIASECHEKRQTIESRTALRELRRGHQSPMIHDLSAEHHPVSSLFPDVNHRTLAGYQLSPKQVDFFHEYGYLTGVGLPSLGQVVAPAQEPPRLLALHRSQPSLAGSAHHRASRRYDRYQCGSERGTAT